MNNIALIYMTTVFIAFPIIVLFTVHMSGKKKLPAFIDFYENKSFYFIVSFLPAINIIVFVVALFSFLLEDAKPLSIPIGPDYK
jgi:thiosulfate reductase cytochrome b subunit